MERKGRFAAFILAALIILSVPAAAASQYHAPVLTLVSSFAPGDLKLTVTIYKVDKNVERVIPVVLESERKGWESHFFLRREAVYGISAWFGNAYDLKDATLTIEHGGESRTYDIPEKLLSERNSEDYISLNWRTGEMKALSPLRAPLVMLMWAAVAIAVEAVVFLCFGYHSKKSWLVLIIVNLVTQSAHHAIISGINVDVNRIKVYIILIPVLFLVEMLAFVMLIDERSRDKTITFAVVANLASQVALGLLMAVLPG